MLFQQYLSRSIYKIKKKSIKRKLFWTLYFFWVWFLFKVFCVAILNTYICNLNIYNEIIFILNILYMYVNEYNFNLINKLNYLPYTISFILFFIWISMILMWNPCLIYNSQCGNNKHTFIRTYPTCMLFSLLGKPK